MVGHVAGELHLVGHDDHGHVLRGKAADDLEHALGQLGVEDGQQGMDEHATLEGAGGIGDDGHRRHLGAGTGCGGNQDQREIAPKGIRTDDQMVADGFGVMGEHEGNTLGGVHAAAAAETDDDIDAGQVRLESRDLVSFLKERCDAFKAPEGKYVRLSFFPIASEAEVRFDPEKFGRAFQILLDNAVKFSPSDTRIKVFVEKKENKDLKEILEIQELLDLLEKPGQKGTLELLVLALLLKVRIILTRN